MDRHPLHVIFGQKKVLLGKIVPQGYGARPPGKYDKIGGNLSQQSCPFERCYSDGKAAKKAGLESMNPSAFRVLNRLGSVLPHLVTYLEDLSAATARASVVWMIGHYQQEVARLAPDVLRRLAKGFAAEKQEVKQQIVVLGLKVWAFHFFNARGEVAVKDAVQATKEAGSKGAAPLKVSPDESAQLLPRLEAIVEHISTLASFDASWDVRDTARALKSIKESAKAAVDSGGKSALEQMGLWYCRACISGAPPLDAAGVDASEKADDPLQKAAIDSTWMIGSLAQALDFPLESYRPLPPWAEENSSDELRKVKEISAEKAREAAPKSISSSTVGNVSHMEQRVQLPSNINNMPVVQSLEDLDLFYSEAPAPALSVPPASRQAPGATLEQMRLAGPLPTAPTLGTAVFGEDDESDEAEDDDDDDDWKYCQQAVPSQAPPPSEPAEPVPPPRVERVPDPAPPAPPAPAEPTEPTNE
ncbi:unnamed protein product [Cladocopium goreaui]|uniref:Uncharacterized protein n=1 Tax=Cladocopium goreaui TaxID=2562237 RepID=A0A9P1CV04_9DINO|nr:unnamed protein product [Cladocopium goreaui]